ncbi:hypothetical protein K445DRAFT_12792 [Daldinia sp. EC12]|nr:hypothetical protein K445DRAFT_12792 [Daldinia sp. EC12]
MDSRASTVTPTPSPSKDWTPPLSPTTGFPSPVPSTKKTPAEKDTPEASDKQLSASPPEGTPVSDTGVATSPRSQQSPEPRRLVLGLPRVIIVYRNGCQSRLHSVYDKKTQNYIYRHDRDRGKSIQMTFRQGRLESLEDILSGDFIYIRGVTHKAQN